MKAFSYSQSGNKDLMLFIDLIYEYVMEELDKRINIL